MPRTQQQSLSLEEQYRAALQRARTEGLSIVGTGLRVIEGTPRPVYFIPSASEPGYLHSVVCMPRALVCDCLAAQSNRYCKHRALARERLEEQRAK